MDRRISFGSDFDFSELAPAVITPYYGMSGEVETEQWRETKAFGSGSVRRKSPDRVFWGAGRERTLKLTRTIPALPDRFTVGGSRYPGHGTACGIGDGPPCDLGPVRGR